MAGAAGAFAVSDTVGAVDLSGAVKTFATANTIEPLTALTVSSGRVGSGLGEEVS